MEVFEGVTLLVTLFTGLSVVHSYTYYAASTFLFLPLLTRVLQRKYMFFLCNLILVFLLQASSRRISHSCSSTLEGHDPMDRVQQGNIIIIDHEEIEEEEEEYKALGVVAEDPGDSEKQVANQGMGVATDLIEEEEEEDSDEQKSLAIIGKQGEVDKESSQLLDEEEDEAEREMGGAGGSNTNNSIEINTEELNQKIEEFIKKMKRELQLEVDAYSPQLIATFN